MSPHVGLLLAGILCGGATVVAAIRAWRRAAGGPALLAALLPLLVYLMLMALVLGVTKGHYGDWDAARLVVSVAWARGLEVYAGPESGAVQTTLYPPGWLLAYLPSALGRTPTAVMAIGYALAPLWSLLPMLLLCRVVSRHWPLALVTTALFVFSSLRVESLWWACYFPHADAPALGWALTAVLALHQARLRPVRDARLWLLAAACCGLLSVWSKQVMLPVLPGLLLWLLILRAWRHAAGLALAMAAIGVMLLLISLAWITPQALWLNLVAIPGRCPWSGQLPFSLLRALLELLTMGGVAVLLIGVNVALRPGAGDADGRRAFLQSVWGPLLLLAVLLIPVSVMGYLKAGGATNSFSPAHYFLFAAACLQLMEACLSVPSTPESAAARSRALNVLVTVGALVGVLWLLQTFRELRYGLRVIHRSPCQQAYDYLRSEQVPRALFPAYPLAHLLAEGRLYHFSHALADREQLARLPLGPEHRARHWPLDADVVCWTARQFASEAGRALNYFPAFTAPVSIPDLSEFRCYQRVAPASRPALPSTP